MKFFDLGMRVGCGKMDLFHTEVNMETDALKRIALHAKKRLTGHLNSQPAKIKIISQEDPEFRKKVEFLLSQKEVIMNPVQYLIDQKVWKKLDSIHRERLLFKTLEKYREIKAEIEKSRQNSC